MKVGLYATAPGPLVNALAGVRRPGVTVTLSLPPPLLQLAHRAARRANRTSTAGRMTARSAYEFLWGALARSRIAESAADVVVVDLAVARALAAAGRAADVVLLERGTAFAIHSALDAEAERAPSFRAHLQLYRASARRCDLEAQALRSARQVVAASAWIARAARSAGAGEVEVVPPPLASTEILANRPTREPARLRVLAPGPLIGRNGARALLDCARQLGGDIDLLVAGRVADDPRAVAPYQGLFRVSPRAGFRALLPWADVVAAPWLIDGYCHELAHALAGRVPVVATEATGLDRSMPGVMVIAAGSSDELAQALTALADPPARARARIGLAALVAERSSQRVQEGVLHAVSRLCPDRDSLRSC